MEKKTTTADLLLQNKKMKDAIKYYLNGINHFYGCIDFGKSNLDGEAIDFMNQSNIKLTNAVKK